MLAAGPLAWLHYFLFLLPLLAYLLRPPREGEKGVAGPIVRLGGLLALLMMIEAPTSFFGYHVETTAICCVLIAALVLTMVLGLAEIWRLDIPIATRPLDSSFLEAKEPHGPIPGSLEPPSPHASPRP